MLIALVEIMLMEPPAHLNDIAKNKATKKKVTYVSSLNDIYSKHGTFMYHIVKCINYK